MMDHVSARCANYRLLFPSRNIEAIVPLGDGVRITRLRGRAPRANTGATPVLDLNRLLGTASSRPLEASTSGAQPNGLGNRSRIQLDWVSTDFERRAALIVDAVDEIVASNLQHLERVPFLPARLQPLCEGVLRDADATCRLGIRLDVVWPLEHVADRRLWRSAMVQLEPVSDPSETSARETPRTQNAGPLTHASV